MKRLLLLAGLLFAAACGNDNYIAVVDNEIVVSPRLTDVGDVPVGTALAFTIGVSNIEGGDTEIRAIDILNFDGDAFRYTGPSTVLVPRDGGAQLAFEYEPPEQGYHRAILTVTSDSVTPQIEVEIRGRGLLATAKVLPPALDFGPVSVGESGVLSVTIINNGVVEITLTEVTSTNTRFGRADDQEFVVQPAVEALLPLEFLPDSEDAQTGEVMLLFGDALVLGPVAVRGNDCERGLPPAYDTDGDGWTTCAGDCDDDDDTVNPAADEEQNGVDDDCDGVIDEGTPGYDDDGDGLTEDEGDCNDADPAVTPDATEVLGNGVDDDCDGIVDQGTADLDFDGYATGGGDCDDGDPSVFPGAPEAADGIDNDCDGVVDEGTTNSDDDGDGFSEAAGDCNDADPTVAPNAPELPDWLDNDCDGDVDEGTVQSDDDGDGFSEQGGDCDDADPLVSPAALEVPGNAIDEDCDGVAQ